MILIIITLKFRPLKSKQGAKLIKKNWFLISEKMKQNTVFVMDIPK